jgi:peptidoglycan/LPS O-acetylase OafA/YrhL
VKTETHLAPIDLLRGVAIALVVMFHLLGTTYGYDHPGFKHLLLNFDFVTPSWWFFSPLAFGWSGVSLFFVISGYLIHRGNWCGGKAIDWQKFAHRRFWRIYPAYLLCLVIFTGLHHISFFSRDFVLHLLLVNDISDDTFFGSINSSFWSLATEVQLYAMYPLLIFARRRWGRISMLVLSCAVAACWMVFAYSSFDLPPANSFIWFSPLALWPTWALGAVIAESHMSGERYFKSPRIWMLLMVAMSVLSLAVQPLRPLAFYFGALGFSTVVDIMASSKIEYKSAFHRGLIWLGVCSYSVYLVNQSMIISLVNELNRLHHFSPAIGMMIGTVVFVPIVLAVGYTGYRLVERAGIKLGRYIGEPPISRAVVVAR